MKLLRTQQHLTALEGEVIAWVQRKPCTFMREYDPEHGSRVVGITWVEKPPPYLGLLIGDCVHNLRATLDYLTWELVLANQQLPTDHTAFPIFKNAGGYAKHAPRMLRGIAPRAAELIGGMQPYHAAEPLSEHPLLMLDRLANIDKHRRLLVTGTWIVGAERADFAFHPGPVFMLRERWPSGANEEAYAEHTLAVTLDEREIPRQESVVVLIKRLLEFTRDSVLARFQPFFN